MPSHGIFMRISRQRAVDRYVRSTTAQRKHASLLFTKAAGRSPKTSGLVFIWAFSGAWSFNRSNMSINTPLVSLKLLVDSVRWNVAKGDWRRLLLPYYCSSFLACYFLQSHSHFKNHNVCVFLYRLFRRTNKTSLVSSKIRWIRLIVHHASHVEGMAWIKDWWLSSHCPGKTRVTSVIRLDSLSELQSTDSRPTGDSTVKRTKGA